MIDPQALAAELNGEAAPLTGFVLDDFWQNQDFTLPCAGAVDHERLAKAVDILKAAGYSWNEEPGPDAVGRGLTAPDGSSLPKFSLLSPTYAMDAQRAKAAIYISRAASLLGVELDVRLSAADELLYDVYGSGNYDLTLLGWRLSAYPAYLCDWFTPSDGNSFAYNGSRLTSACEAWRQTSNLEEARAHVSDIQAILAQDLPLIPLYTGMRVDAYQNIRYPFGEVVDGLSGLYAAPALAIPIP
jgi:ABC-type transport system substrate-binding protein